MMKKLKVIILLVFLIFGTTVVNGTLHSNYNSQLDEAKSSFIAGNINLSIDLINDYIQNNPPNASAWNLKGMINLQNGSYLEAEKSFFQAINISPNDLRIYYNLGLASFHQADFYHAEEYFNRSISQDFEIPEQYFYLGLSQYGLAKYDSAIDSFNKSIELHSGDPAVWLNLGITYEKIRRMDKAILSYDEAINLDPSYAKPWFLKGKIFIEYGNSTYATYSFQNYTRLQPNDDIGWFWYANSLRKINLRNESLTALQKAINLNPENRQYKEYLKIYDYGNYRGLIYDYTVTPLPFPFVIVVCILLIIFSLIAFLRR
jgi:tetratricopeptide (TPR) repeat protein